MSLSEKIVNYENVLVCDVKSIKEAVKALKEILLANNYGFTMKILNKIFGEELT